MQGVEDVECRDKTELETFEMLLNSSSKFLFLDKLLAKYIFHLCTHLYPRLQASKSRVLIFSQLVILLDLLGEIFGRKSLIFREIPQVSEIHI